MKLVSETILLPQKYTVPEDQIAQRDALLECSRANCEAVTDQQSQELAAASGRLIHAHIKEVQLTRMELAQPLHAANAKLIELERAYLAPLVAEKDRLGREMSAHRVREEERVAREERERQAEFQRLEQERQALERKAAQEAPGSAKAIKLEQRANDAMEAATAVLTAPPVEVSKAKGAATRKELKWEVTDESALYAAAPHLFSRPELKPSAVKATCNAGTKLPGIRFWEEDKTSFRA